MATTMQLGVLADLVEGRARRMWPGRWPERVAAELAELEAADWAPLLAAVACRRTGRQRKRTAGPPA